MGQRSVKDFNSYINEAINNIRNDRQLTSDLLSDIMLEMQSSAEAPSGNGHQTHKDLGLIAAKYLETLQRSNEQLVKLTSLMQKTTNNSKDSLSEDDKKEIFDLIQGSGG